MPTSRAKQVGYDGCFSANEFGPVAHRRNRLQNGASFLIRLSREQLFYLDASTGSGTQKLVGSGQQVSEAFFRTLYDDSIEGR